MPPHTHFHSPEVETAKHLLQSQWHQYPTQIILTSWKVPKHFKELKACSHWGVQLNLIPFSVSQYRGFTM